MGFCLFIKPFRSLKRRLQIKGDLKRHSFASFVRSSSSSGARVDRRNLYFLDNESSPLFTTSLHQHVKSIAHGQDYNGQTEDSSLGSDENENDEINEREDIEALSQNAVQDALSTVAEEYLEDFANKIVEYTLKKISVENDEGTTSGQKERTILHDRDIETLNTNKQFVSDTVPSQKPRSPQDDRSPPTDYTMLCVPKDYSIFGNKVEDLTKEDREAMLSKRGVWPGDEAIEYQFEFVAMMKSIEAENERSEREVGGHKAARSRMTRVDVSDSVEGDDESSDDDDDGLTITFEVGPSEINRHPDQRSHSDSSEQGVPSDCTLNEEDKSPPSPCLSPTQSDSWTDTPTRSSPPVATSPPPYWRRTPPPSPPPSRFVHHHVHPSPRQPMMGSSQEAWHDNHQMRMPRMKGTVGAKEWEEGVRYVPKTDYRRQGRDRRHYESPPHYRASPYQVRSNYRNGQRFGPRCDSRQISNHHEDRDYLTAVGQPTYPEHARYQHPPRPRPVPSPYHPNSQSAYYDHRAPPQSCRQAAARWDGPVHQSHPFRQEWGGPSPQFGYSYHPHHHHHHHHHHLHHRDYDRNNFNRRQR